MQTKQFTAFFIVLPLLLLFASCNNNDTIQPPPRELFIYCGTTMEQPIRALARRLEQRENCLVKVLSDGSDNLYHGLSVNRKGDLFFPGCESLIETGVREQLIAETVTVGSNQAAFLVAKGNPLHIPADLNALLDPLITIVLGSPDSGSIGRETREILTSAGIYDQVFHKAMYLTSDSEGLTGAIAAGAADLVINWRAAAHHHGELLEVLPLDESVAAVRKLTIGLLRFSSQPELAKRFMELAASEEGRALFGSYGFGE